MNRIMEDSKSFNPLNHQIVPQHILLSEKEEAQVLKELSKMQKTEKEQLPKIKKNDPVIVKINAQVGDIIKVIRKSQTAGEGIFYRLVIE